METHDADGRREYFTIMYQPNSTGESNSFSTYTHSILPDVHRIGDTVIYSLYSEHPNFNMVYHSAEFTREAAHFALIDSKTHKGSVMARGFPEEYVKNPFKLFSFSFVRFDLFPDGKLLVSFEATPELYICDMNGRPIGVFGTPGKNMDQDYLSVNSFELEEIIKFRKNRESKGYYGSIKVVGNRVFRSYRKGGESPVDGLQIYENEVLIADVDVPKDFSVIGVSGNTVISNVQYNEDSERLFCYEFELE